MTYIGNRTGTLMGKFFSPTPCVSDGLSLGSFGSPLVPMVKLREPGEMAEGCAEIRGPKVPSRTSIHPNAS